MEEKDFELCMSRLCEGDKEALHDIYTALGPYIYHFILGILKNKEDAEDVTSEFFIRLWRSADRYKPGNGYKTYITVIARNMAIDYLRARGRESLIEDIFPQKSEDSSVYNTEDMITSGANTGAVAGITDGEGMNGAGVPDQTDVTANEAVGKVAMEEALSKLKPPEPQIIHMRFALDMTFAEIAEVLKIPMGTVTWKYREAISKLRRCGYAF